MADGDLLGSDEDVFDQQPQHTLAVFDGAFGGAGVQPGLEAFEVIGELEVGVAAVGLGVEGVDLSAEVLLVGAQVRHLRSQFVDGDQQEGGLGVAGGESLRLHGFGTYNSHAGPAGPWARVTMGRCHCVSFMLVRLGRPWR